MTSQNHVYAPYRDEPAAPKRQDVPQIVLDAMREAYLALDKVHSTVPYGDEIAAHPLDALDAAYKAIGIPAPDVPDSYDEDDDEGYPPKCSNPEGHVWNRTAGEADEARLSGNYENDNIRCIYCGADGDA